MKKILLAISAVALMFAGCTKDFTNDVAGSAAIERGAIVEKTLVFEDSRISRNGEGKLSWSEGDQIAVVLAGENGALALDTQKYTVDHVNGKVGIPENTAYVIYPASLVSLSLSGTTASFRLAHIKNIAKCEHIFDIAPMKGTIAGDVIEFNNLMSFAKFPLTGTGKLKSAVLRSICSTTGNFHPISNQASIDLSGNVLEGGGLKMSTNNSSFAWMRIGFTEDVDLSKNPSVYFPIPEGEYENLGLVLVTDEGTYTIYANSKHQFVRSTVKSVSSTPINLADHKPENAVSVAGTTGNAYEDYASCYMVPPTAGSYKFPCTLADGTVLKGGVTAELKWAEEAGMIYDIFFDAETNEISFKTNGKEGNALVVLTDNTYESATILWTWHIWITDAPKTLKIMGSGDNKNIEYYLMDRVVGATWAPSSTIEATGTQSWITKDKQNNDVTNTVNMSTEVTPQQASEACGVYFQYQNRNPYPRVKDILHIGGEDIASLVNTRCDVMYGFSQYSQYWSASGSAGGVWEDERNGLYVHNGIRYPNYQYSVSGTTSSTSSWAYATLLNSQGKTDQSVVVDGGFRLWNSINDNNHNTMMKYKTVHDVCPPGYVMENYSGLYWYMTEASRIQQYEYARAVENNESYSGGFKFYGMYYNSAVNSDGSPVALYLPCAGARNSGKTGLSGSYGNMGYLYVVNTNNGGLQTFDVVKGDDTYKIGKGGNVQYGASTSGKTIGWPGANATKLVNAQAYNVRCRRGKF